MDWGAMLRAIMALAVTIGLLGLIAYAARRFDLSALLNSEGKRPEAILANILKPRPASLRRIQIVEQRALDARSRLILVRWDETEHLVLIGAGDGTLIASKPAAMIATTTEGAA